jgi:uncharacterized membrane protein YuzA (DUF378 family)
MYKLSLIDKISLILVTIGALNWGLYGLFSLDLVKVIFGQFQVLARIVYILVGVSGLNLIFLWIKARKK